MARGPAVVVDGLKEARRDIRTIDRKLNRELGRDIKQAVERELLPTARRLAPKRTGALAGSIRVSSDMRGATIRSRLPYANVIHWGGSVPSKRSTSRRPKRRFKRTLFLVRAAQQEGPEVEEGIAKAMDGFLRRNGFK